MAFRISTNPVFEIGGVKAGGEFVRLNDGALVVRDDASDDNEDDDAPNLRAIIPRVARVKRGDPYDKPDPEQEAFAQRIADLLNGAA